MPKSTVSHERELPMDRLASMDERGHRVFLHPADVNGPFRSRRNLVHGLLIVLFLVLPWIQINGHQALLLDIGQRRFAIFGLAFWAHDAPMLIFVFGAVFLGISLTTAIWGRLWCGWGCPETVFVDSVYRRIERWTDGNAVQRRRLDAAPWNGNKIARRALKWGAWLVVTLVITHSFIAYFVGTEGLAEMMRHTPSENPGTFGVMAFLTAVLLFSFGWFREQFCIIMCPYGRFQSVLLDAHSMTVAYDEVRGEPRRGATRVEPAQAAPDAVPAPQGDCINCYRCVQVCPTGIDIRRGLQLECVACTSCIDACDEVMTNLHKPKGLIRYTTESELKGQPVRLVRPRVVILSLALTGVLCGLVYTLVTRPPIKATAFSAKTTPYQVLDATRPDPLLSNQFYLVASNYNFHAGEVRIAVTEPAGVEVIAQLNPLPLNGGEERKEGFFLKFPKSLLSQGHALARIELQTRAQDGRWQRTLTQEVPLAGPF
ncbi:MAG: cytochrome c oxidase accessory protein CcoG [Candidatus Sericytochromatia bacterium]